MGALGGFLIFVHLAWVLLSSPLARVEGSDLGGPCEQQLRYRQRSAEVGKAWGPTAALFMSACAVWVFVLYAIRCMCASKDLRAQEISGLEKHGEGSQDSCTDGDADSAAKCGSQALACSQTRCGSRSPTCSRAQQAYARQLACMEKELESFLCEVRNRRCALQDVQVDEELPANVDLGADKLRITVYEIADCEGPNRVQLRGRKRQCK